MHDPKQIARRHYDADAEALGDGERLTVDEPVGWLTGVVDPPSDPDQEEAVREEYQRLRDEHGGRPRHEAGGVEA